ncbi:hypothetical protein FACS18945_2760 [Bacteroidia bacterium]|nr:hypothetical protein FACS18945_2760 [Bacteroidia bacterium]
MKKTILAKYAGPILLSLFSFGKIKAQTDTTKTLDYTRIKDAVGATLLFEAEATNQKWDKMVAAPLSINQKVTFSNKYELAAIADIFIHNLFNSNQFDITPFDMFLSGKIKTNVGDFGIKVGHFSNTTQYTWSGLWAKYTPARMVAFSSLNLNDGHFFPKAVVATYSGKIVNIIIGYAEDDPDNAGFAFNGKNPEFIAMYEKEFGAKFSIAGQMQTNGKQTDGNIYVMYNPNSKSHIMMNLLNLGSCPAVASTYRFDAKKLSIVVNGMWQKGGVCGGTIGCYFPSGIYINTGGLLNDPRLIKNADGTPNSNAKKFVPRLGIGYYRQFNFGK